MRRSMSGGIALALLLGLAGHVLAADPDTSTSTSTSGGWSWMPSWLGGKKKPASKKDQELQILEKPKPTAADLAAALREKEWNAMWRRQQAADKLEVLAFEAGDEEQVRRIQQLRERIHALYLKRTARLSDSPGSSEMDEGLLEKNLGTTSRRPDLLTGDADGGEGGRTANWGGDKR